MLKRIYFGVFQGTKFVQMGNGGQNAVILKNVYCIDTEERLSLATIPLTPVVSRALTHIQIDDKVIFRLSRPDLDTPPKVDAFYILPHWYHTVPTDDWNSVLDELNAK